MPSRFCPSCAKENKFDINKPAFCGFCGKKFDFSGGTVAATPSIPKQAPIYRKPEVYYQEPEELDIEFKFEIEGEDDRKMKFQEICGTSKVAPQAVVGSKISKKKKDEMIQNFLSSCKNTGRPIEVEDV